MRLANLATYCTVIVSTFLVLQTALHPVLNSIVFNIPHFSTISLYNNFYAAANCTLQYELIIIVLQITYTIHVFNDKCPYNSDPPFRPCQLRRKMAANLITNSYLSSISIEFVGVCDGLNVVLNRSVKIRPKFP